MKSLDLAMAKIIEEKFDLEQLVFMLIVQKLEDQGHQLSSEQLMSLKKQIAEQVTGSENDIEVIHIELDDGTEEQREADLTVTPSDYQILEERVDEAILKTIHDVTSRLADHLLEEWKSQASEILIEQRDEQQDFSDRLRQIWGKALDLLEILLGTSLQAGIEFNRKLRSKAHQENDLVFDVLTRLHARGCQIAKEIHILLSHGLADGAHARWRTLHEVSVIAGFISEHGQEVAERYILHTGIESYKAALQHQKHYRALGWSPFSEAEMSHLKAQYDKLIKQFGKDFKNDYGWASKVLSNPRPTFFDIEQNAGLEHVHPFVKIANTNIHASAKGIAHRLGLLPDMVILLAGSSIYGLGDPGRNTAFSLILLTATTLLYKPDVEQLVNIQAMQGLHLEIHDAFYEVEFELDGMTEDE